MALTKAQAARTRKVHKFAAAGDTPVRASSVAKFTDQAYLPATFEVWLRVHKVGSSTQAGYWLVLRKYVEFLRDRYGTKHAKLSDLNPVTVSDFIAHREQEVSKHTARAAYITLKAFGKWLKTQGYPCDLSSVESVKHIPARNRLGEDQVTALLAAAASSTNGNRDLLLCKFVLACGLRLNEVRELQVGDIHFDAVQPYIAVRAETAKNSKARQVRLWPDIKLELYEYLRRYHPHAALTDPVFLTQELQMFSPGGLGGCLRSIKRRAGISDRVGWHSLRHVYSYSSVAVGMPLPDLMAELGHANLSTTQRYVAIRPPAERFAVASPLALALRGTNEKAVHNAHRPNNTDTRTTHTDGKTRVRFGEKRSRKAIKTG